MSRYDLKEGVGAHSRQTLEGGLTFTSAQQGQQIRLELYRLTGHQLPLQQLVDEFSERLAAGAEQNIQRYFATKGAPGITAGGRRAISGPMRYTQSRQRVANDDIGALGEGVAGYYLENIERLQFEIRPFDISPDFIFLDPSANSLILCEVKASLEVWPRTLYTNAIDLLEVLSKTWLIVPRKYTAYVVHVKIVGPADFELRRLRLEVV